MRVHVVTRDGGALLAVVCRACGPRAEVLRWEDVPIPNQIRAGDVVVVDALNRQLGTDARRASECALAAELSSRLGSPSAEVVAAGLAERCAEFRGLGALVAAVLGAPSRVRRPVDLALEAGVSRKSLLASCRAAGFGRVEHFICAVRVAAWEALVEEHALSRAEALNLVGVRDLSNFRRQAARAGLRLPASPAAAARHGGGDAGRSAPGQVARVLLAALLLAGSALSVACGGGSAGGQGTADAAASPNAAARGDSAVALPVVGALVRRGDLVLSVRATGAVRAERMVTLKAETQGTVDEVAVRPGDRVEGAQVLVRLDPRPFDLAVREAEASLAETRIRVQDALLGDNPADTSAGAELRRRGARQRNGLDGAEARLARAQLERERATLAAPFAGVVDRVGVVAGQRVSAGEEIARIVDMGSLAVEASVLEHDLPLVRAGGVALVTPSASPGESYRGTIRAVLPVVDTTTRAGRVLVGVRTGDGRLRPGMYADVRLEAARLANRVIVPAGAVIERDGRTLVFRARDGRAEWVYVPVGRTNGADTEILPDSVSGRTNIEPGDTVLVGGHLTLTHDAPIRVRLQEGRARP